AQVQTADTQAAAIEGASLAISAVTASSATAVASQAARSIRPGQIFLDINSVSPATKREEAALIEAAGADYVEAAVMAPVPPQRLKVPMLLGGRRAYELAPALQQLGMNATAISDRSRFSGQDVPQRHDQGDRVAGGGVPARRASLRRRAGSARIPPRDVSQH